MTDTLEPGQYVVPRDVATGIWTLDGVCGHCRERVTEYDHPTVILPRMDFGPPDYRRVIYRAVSADSGVFHAKCAQRRFHDEPERLPPELQPQQVTVWPDPDLW